GSAFAANAGGFNFFIGGGTLALSDMAIHDNSAGPALYVGDKRTVQLVRSSFFKNSGPGFDASLANSIAEVENCTFGSTATRGPLDSTGANGGKAYLRVKHSTLSGSGESGIFVYQNV